MAWISNAVEPLVLPAARGIVNSELSEGHLTVRVAGSFAMAIDPKLSEIMAVQLPQADAVTFDLRDAGSIETCAVGMMLVACHQPHQTRDVRVLCRAGGVLSTLQRLQMHRLTIVQSTED